MKRLLLFLFVFFGLSVCGYAQGARFGDSQPVWTANRVGGAISSVASATVAFCDSPANAVPCTNKTTTYTDSTLGTACPTARQLVLAGTTACVATTDGYGNWGVWVIGGQYNYTITTPNGSYGPFPVTVTGPGNSVSYIGVASGLPSVCTVGQLAFVTDATPGQNIYEATAVGPPCTWVQQLNSGAAGANTSLSNLSGVAINSNLLPNTAGTKNLGSTALPFANLLLGVIANETANFDLSVLSANRTYTFPNASGTFAVSATSPITLNTGAVACATCTTSASSLTNNQLLFGAGSQGMAVGDLTGDTTTSGGKATVTAKVNGVSFPASPSTHQIPTVTSSNTVTWKSLLDCQDSTGNHMNYTLSTDTWTCGTSSSSSSTAWSAITAPGSALSLTMAGNTSTFNTTSALAAFFAWKNTTAAIAGTSQGSPVLSTCGRAFHGSADVEDCLTLSELPGNGNDAAITFNINHTGTSTGTVTTAFPGPVQSGSGGGVGGTVTLPEGTAPSGSSNNDLLYANSTSHRVLEIPNNGTALILSGIAAAGTSGDCVKLAANGIDLSDFGGTCGSLSGLTTGYIPKASSATAIANSLCDEAITTANTLTCTNTAGMKVVALLTGTSPPACTAGSAGAWCATEGTAFTNVASTAGIYPDSTQHEFLAKTNGASSAGMLVRAQPGSIHSTGNTGTISTATLCAASAGACNTAGMYHIHFDFIETGTACATPATGGVTFLFTWTDSNATAHSAVSLGMDDASAINAVSQTFHFQTTLAAAWASGDFNVSTNGSIIQYATGYTACGVGTGTYQLDAVVTRLQ